MPSARMLCSILSMAGVPELRCGDLGEQDLDGLAALRALALADGLDLLLGLDRLGTGDLGIGLRRRFLQRLGIERDRLVHGRRLDLAFAPDLELAQLALTADAGFVEATVGGDTRPLDLLVRDDLRLAWVDGIRGFGSRE